MTHLTILSGCKLRAVADSCAESMPLPRRCARRPSRSVFGLVCAVFLSGGGMLWAQDRPAPPPSSTANPLEAVTRQPLSRETWPLWRETYTRILFADEQDPVQERRFYEQVGAFFRATVAASGGSLPKEFADDPVAWAALAWAYLHGAEDARSGGAVSARDLTAAEDACRKAIALGDPQGIASYSLAEVLVYRGRLQGPDKPLTGEMERRLAEAEERLRHVERISPRAEVDLWRGRMAELRGDKKNAELLFRKAADAHPKSAQSALAYLMSVLATAQAPAAFTDFTEPFAKRFPRDPKIQAVHAAALYKDERFSEAAETLRRARDLDERAVRLFGNDLMKDIEEGRQITPKVASGLKAMKSGFYSSAKTDFRQALDDNPQNVFAARWLTRAILKSFASGGHLTVPSAVIATSANEISELCRQFPDDAEMQAGLAIALHLAGRHGEAARALDRVEPLGGRLDELIDAASVVAIRERAANEETSDFWQSVALAVGIGAAIWIAAMFALGAILAVCIPRIPKSIGLTGTAQSRREVWLERFYWFWWLYLRAYTLLSTGFSRSREFLADRRAALAYGKQTFVSGLTKVSVDGVLFDSTVYPSVRSLLSQGKAYANAFDVFRHVRQQSLDAPMGPEQTSPGQRPGEKKHSKDP